MNTGESVGDDGGADTVAPLGEAVNGGGAAAPVEGGGRTSQELTDAVASYQPMVQADTESAWPDSNTVLSDGAQRQARAASSIWHPVSGKEQALPARLSTRESPANTPAPDSRSSEPDEPPLIGNRAADLPPGPGDDHSTDHVAGDRSPQRGDADGCFKPLADPRVNEGLTAGDLAAKSAWAELTFVEGTEHFLADVRKVEFLVNLREEFHRRPDQDAIIARIDQIFRDRGCNPVEIPGGGLYVDIGGDPGEAGFIAIRADIDPLEINEETGSPFSSEIPGYAQACGHDVHTDAVLGAGLVLLERDEAIKDIPGKHRPAVRLIFQRDEEKALGAEILVKHGVLNGASEVIALHCNPKLDEGTVAINDVTANWGVGKYSFDLVRNANDPTHTARPGEGPDLIDRAGEIKKTLRSAAAAELRSPDLAVKPPNLVVSQISTTNPPNVFPSRVVMGGTVRFADIPTQQLVQGGLSNLVAEVSVANGAVYDADSYSYEHLASPVVNAARVVERFNKAAEAVGPGFGVIAKDMEGADDLERMTNYRPRGDARSFTFKGRVYGRPPTFKGGGYGQLGTGDPEIPLEERVDLHDPRYLPDAGAIFAGIRLLVAYVDPAHATPELSLAS